MIPWSKGKRMIIQNTVCTIHFFPFFEPSLVSCYNSQLADQLGGGRHDSFALGLNHDSLLTLKAHYRLNQSAME